MTVTLVVTVMIAAAGGSWRVWTLRRSGPRLRVEGRKTWLPEQYRSCWSPELLCSPLTLFEVTARNTGGRGTRVGEWGFVSRSGVVIRPPGHAWEAEPVMAFLSCKVPCLNKAEDHVHRWFVDAGYLWEQCGKESFERQELVRVEDLRPWVRRCGDGKWIRAARWGLPDEEFDDPRASAWRDAWHRWAVWWWGLAARLPARVDSWRERREAARPVEAVFYPARVPVYGSLEEFGRPFG